jgi:lysophospholipid acyltransferase (LPLAT)-like uncharacterized protein
VRLFIYSYRYEYSEINSVHRAKSSGSVIFAVWHEQMIAFLTAHAWTEPYLALASRSKDGDYAAHIASRLGFIPVRGSSRNSEKDKGGKQAIEEYIQKLGSGYSGGITVDGPKGPRHFCKIGIAKIAQETGCPIIPGVAVASRHWVINSWDQFKIPKPFAKITLTYAEPIWVNKDATQEELVEVCTTVEQSMKAML